MHTLALQVLHFESLCTGISGKFEFNANCNNDTQTIYGNTQQQMKKKKKKEKKEKKISCSNCRKF